MQVSPILMNKSFDTSFNQITFQSYWRITVKSDYDDVIKWKHFRVTGHLCREFIGPRWIPRTKASERGALMFSLICVCINDWVNNREAGDLRRYRAHYDVIAMCKMLLLIFEST